MDKAERYEKLTKQIKQQIEWKKGIERGLNGPHGIHNPSSYIIEIKRVLALMSELDKERLKLQEDING